MLENVHAPKCIHAFNTKNNLYFYRKSELKKTGGGPPPPELKCWERKVQ